MPNSDKDRWLGILNLIRWTDCAADVKMLRRSEMADVLCPKGEET